MKKSITKIALCISIFCLSACKNEKGIQEKEIVFLYDGTDKKDTLPDFEILKKTIIPQNPINGSIFKCGVINDIEFSGVIETELKPKLSEDETAEETYARRKTYIKKSKENYINQSYLGVEKDKSIIYPVIVKQLNELSQSQAKTKALYVYSDLYENSDLLNVYNPKQFNELKNKKSKFIQKFEEKYPLQDLNGIEVYFIYKPKDFDDNMKYKELYELYISILTNKGAKCITI